MMRKPEAILGIVAIFLLGAIAGILLSRGSLPGLGEPAPRKVEEALNLIRGRYVEELTREELARAAIEGMVETLDPYSTYLDMRVIGTIQDELEGEFGGIGIWFEMVSDSARVVSVIPGGPSEEAGIRAGDRIVAIDDSTCVGERSLAIQRRIRGPEGESVTLTILRPVLQQRFQVSIEREIIPIRSVEASFRLPDSTAYVRISRFTSGTAEEFRSAVSELRQQGPLRGLLLDLRDNPGGILEAAVRVSDEILSEGRTIVSTDGRGVEEREVYTSSGGGLAEDAPVIILVNENSASASEIVAGAVQDHDRGLVVGHPTFGKGLVQRQFMFSDGSAMHLTVARYYTPAGRPIQNDLDREVPTHFGRSVDDTVSNDRTDSLTAFSTLNGREILGGQGIYPDRISPVDTLMGAFELVFRTGLDLGFSREWFDSHESELRREWANRSEEYVANYRVTDSVWNRFLDHARSQAGSLWLRYSDAEINVARPEIETLIKARIAQSLFGPHMWFSIVSKVDPEISFASRFWEEAAALPGAPGNPVQPTR